MDCCCAVQAEHIQLKLAKSQAQQQVDTLKAQMHEAREKEAAQWEHHEKELSRLSVWYPFVLTLSIDEPGQPTIVKTFRDGAVIDLPDWPPGGSTIVEGVRVEHRSPRPCPQYADGSDQPAPA